MGLTGHWVSCYDEAIETNKQLQTERDQLKARVARLDGASRKMLEDLHGYSYLINGVDMKANMRAVLNETPAQSLNAIKADALREAANEQVITTPDSRKVMNGTGEWLCNLAANLEAAQEEAK